MEQTGVDRSRTAEPNKREQNRTELNKNPTEQIGIQRIRTEQSGPEHNGIE